MKLPKGQFIKKLGEGGEADVYLFGELPNPKSWMAVKVLKATPGDKNSGLKWENQILKRMRHPHIIKSYGIRIIPNGKLGLALEFVQGTTLHAQIEKTGSSKNSKLALKISRTLLSTLYDVHKNGIVHGDVSSKNIMLDDQGHVKLIDFGIASLVKSKTSKPMIKGNPLYLSERRWLGYEPSEADDLFGLGLVIVEIFQGRHPFKGIPLFEMKDQVTNFVRAKKWKADTPSPWHKFLDFLFLAPSKKERLEALRVSYPKFSQ
jgi:serine/threonine-protein kinase